MTLRVGLATQADLPDWEVDDRFLRAALDARGIAHDQPVWTDPDVDWAGYDAVVPRTTWDYAWNPVAFGAWIDRVAGLTTLLNPPEVLRWSADKAYLRELAQAGVPIAPTVWLERGSAVDVGALMAERGWARGFLKPRVGQTARETLRFDASEAGLQAANAHCARLLPSEGLMLQPYLPAVETLGERSGVFFDGELAHGVRKIPVPGDYRVMDDFGATDEPCTLDPAALEVCRRALAAIPSDRPLLYARVDLLQDHDDRPVLTELELVEPSLFFRHAPESAARLADALVRRLG